MTDTRATSPAPTPSTRPEVDRLRRQLRRLFGPFWVVPAGWSVLAVVAGLTLPELDQVVGDQVLFLFSGGVDSARSVLSSMVTAMISVTTLVFSVTLVALQLASSQFSPRVLATFLEDRLTQHTLGVFAASFLYSLTVLRSITDAPEASGLARSAVPQVAVTVAFLLVLGAVAMFLAFIHHITQSMTVSTIIHRVGDQTRDLLERSRARGSALPDPPVALPALSGQSVATATRTGYIDSLEPDVLCRRAGEHDVRVELLHPLGTFVPEGAPLALVQGARPGSDVDWSRMVSQGVGLARERSMDQDLTYGFRRLVDIAERALSPGVNDPTTAVQAVDEMHDILRRMSSMPRVVGVHLDADDVPRVVTTEWSFAQYLDLAVDEVAHWGKDGVQIPARLRSMLVDLGAAALGEHQQTVRDKLAWLDDAEQPG